MSAPFEPGKVLPWHVSICPSDEWRCHAVALRLMAHHLRQTPPDDLHNLTKALEDVADDLDAEAEAWDESALEQKDAAFRSECDADLQSDD
jgi:hypothetical protein